MQSQKPFAPSKSAPLRITNFPRTEASIRGVFCAPERQNLMLSTQEQLGIIDGLLRDGEAGLQRLAENDPQRPIVIGLLAIGTALAAMVQQNQPLVLEHDTGKTLNIPADNFFNGDGTPMSTEYLEEISDTSKSYDELRTARVDVETDYRAIDLQKKLRELTENGTLGAHLWNCQRCHSNREALLHLLERGKVSL